jgi:hypothetical protein
LIGGGGVGWLPDDGQTGFRLCLGLVDVGEVLLKLLHLRRHRLHFHLVVALSLLQLGTQLGLGRKVGRSQVRYLQEVCVNGIKLHGDVEAVPMKYYYYLQ